MGQVYVWVRAMMGNASIRHDRMMGVLRLLPVVIHVLWAGVVNLFQLKLVDSARVAEACHCNCCRVATILVAVFDSH